MAAVFATAIVASLFSTQFVIAGLSSLGVDISFAQRVSMSFSDLAILQTLPLVIGACFFIGFVIAAACNKFIGGNRRYWYALAGGCAFLSALLILSAFFQLMPIAGARTHFGLFCQTFAGAIGGLIFAQLSKRKTTSG